MPDNLIVQQHLDITVLLAGGLLGGGRGCLRDWLLERQLGRLLGRPDWN